MAIPEDGYHGEYVKDLALDVLAESKQVADGFNAFRASLGLPPIDYIALRDAEKSYREKHGGRSWMGGTPLGGKVLNHAPGE